MINSWNDILEIEKQKSYFKNILNYIETKRKQGIIIYPDNKNIFNAFKYTDYNNLKVVILGQDPYHGEGQAHGLSFSVQSNQKIPPSLKNIYKELSQDIKGFQIPNHGNLTSWANQGVLMLNTVLTVENKKPHSHAKIGWKQFTDEIINIINKNKKNIIFLLWGKHAQQKCNSIDQKNNFILTAAHPSPLSAYRGFLGCRHFSKTNQILAKNNQKIINWQL